MSSSRSSVADAKLCSWFEIFKDFTPITFIASATAMTFVNNDEIDAC
jgi:hypothetical protein